MAKLQAKTVGATGKNALPPGRHSDGNGLFLFVDESGAKRWIFMFTWEGRKREMGLGSFRTLTLAEARAKASEQRALLDKGVNPLDSRKVAAGVPTFGELAEAVIVARRADWRGKKTEQGWRNSLFNHAASLAPLKVDAVTTVDVLEVLKPIWSPTPEIAQKTQNRIEQVLDVAKVEGHRQGDNPGRWHGHLEHLLGKKRKLTRGPHPAMPYEELPAFMRALGSSTAAGSLALRFTILTASREDMALGARWGEIDLDAAVWTVPGVRMKGSAEEKRADFKVPLSKAALAVLAEAANWRGVDPLGADYVFPGAKPGRPLSNATMDKVLDTRGLPYVPHGFRSTFSDWANDETDHHESIVEHALAHLVGSAVQRAYRRRDAFRKRVILMSDWGCYACGEAEPVRLASAGLVSRPKGARAAAGRAGKVKLASPPRMKRAA